MKHVIIGGDGFVGRQLTEDLLRLGEPVLVADINKSPHAIYDKAPFVHLDITGRASVEALPLNPDDVIYNLSARMLSPILPHAKRRDWFWPVNATGVAHLLSVMQAKGCKNLVHFTTDMVYGRAQTIPQTEEHPTRPLGPYGDSKLVTEEMCEQYRAQGMRISIFRPRLIIGPGRLGILSKLFKLIDLNLPVPMIGGGKNPYQFVSVYDCASACICAWRAGFPNEAYNLGSDDPPPVRTLLGRLIREAGSWSVLVPTPAPLVKAALSTLDTCNAPLMDPEQFLIADEFCVLDCSKAKREIGWRPLYGDEDMLIAAYREYRNGLKASANGEVPADSARGGPPLDAPSGERRAR